MLVSALCKPLAQLPLPLALIRAAAPSTEPLSCRDPLAGPSSAGRGSSCGTSSSNSVWAGGLECLASSTSVSSNATCTPFGLSARSHRMPHSLRERWVAHDAPTLVHLSWSHNSRSRSSRSNSSSRSLQWPLPTTPTYQTFNLRRGLQTSRTPSASGSPSSEQPTCWSCGHRNARVDVACASCGKLQPLPDSINHFELLGLPEVQFDLDPDELEKHFRRLQWQVHPDRFARHSEPEASVAAEMSTRANMAYSVLRSPLRRAKYLLRLWGRSAPSREEEAATISDPAFLMKVMEAREEIEECHDQQKLRGLLERNRAEQEQVVGRLAAALQRLRAEVTAGEHSAATDAHMSPAAVSVRDVITELTYLVKIEEEIVRSIK